MVEQTLDAEILIVGFGFAVIPLLREYERSGQSYTLISEGPSIWEQLDEADRLDFDLVSSFHGSFYASDQIAQGVVDDFYPSAREFYRYQKQIFRAFQHAVIEDTVTAVTNFADHSVVRTLRGRIFRARQVVFATGLHRPQNETIKNFDIRGIEGKTIVFGTIGDTANMMAARAVAQGNRVILVNNGFIALDKLIVVDTPGGRLTIDLAQTEVHTAERYFRRFYKGLFSLPIGPPGPDSPIGRMLLPHLFHMRFPETYRAASVNASMRTRAGIANGMIFIKYWPIDSYEALFGDDLDEHIKRGMILNDIAFFHSEGLVETWRKRDTTVDLDRKTIHREGETVAFDHYIGGSYEHPRLPPITIVDDDGSRRSYAYRYRDSFLGVVPSQLRNVFFIGYTRPTTGGVANITEMQALLVHELSTDAQARARLYASIDERIAAYNAYYYEPGSTTTPTDHLVYFGLYTHDVARFLGLARKLRHCISWNPLRTVRELNFELTHPNNPLKSRMAGKYALEGAERLCRGIARRNSHWALSTIFMLSALFDQLIAALGVGLVYVEQGLRPALEAGSVTTGLVIWTLVSVGLMVLLTRHARYLNIMSYSTAVMLILVKIVLQPLTLLALVHTGNWRLCILHFLVWACLTIGFRQFHRPPLSGRYLFGDCKFKHRYRDFWQRYLDAYRRVNAER